MLVIWRVRGEGERGSEGARLSGSTVEQNSSCTAMHTETISAVLSIEPCKSRAVPQYEKITDTT